MSFFFFNDTATTEIYTLSLHDALPICDIEALSRLFIAVVQRDGAAALRGLEALGVRYSPEVRADLVRDLREFLNKYSGLSVGEVTLGQRSEERRVGKECRSRWSPYH